VSQVIGASKTDNDCVIELIVVFIIAMGLTLGRQEKTGADEPEGAASRHRD